MDELHLDPHSSLGLFPVRRKLLFHLLLVASLLLRVWLRGVLLQLARGAHLAHGLRVLLLLHLVLHLLVVLVDWLVLLMLVLLWLVCLLLRRLSRAISTELELLLLLLVQLALVMMMAGDCFIGHGAELSHGCCSRCWNTKQATY